MKKKNTLTFPNGEKYVGEFKIINSTVGVLTHILEEKNMLGSGKVINKTVKVLLYFVMEQNILENIKRDSNMVEVFTHIPMEISMLGNLKMANTTTDKIFILIQMEENMLKSGKMGN